MGRFRKKPVEIEARQFTDETKDEIYHWARNIQYNVYATFEDDKPVLKIPTSEGVMICSLGDWLIIEPFPTTDRKLYPCKPCIFNRTYEPIT